MNQSHFKNDPFCRGLGVKNNDLALYVFVAAQLSGNQRIDVQLYPLSFLAIHSFWNKIKKLTHKTKYTIKKLLIFYNFVIYNLDFCSPRIYVCVSITGSLQQRTLASYHEPSICDVDNLSIKKEIHQYI